MPTCEGLKFVDQFQAAWRRPHSACKTLHCCLWPSSAAHQNHAHRCNIHVCIGRARHVKHADQPPLGVELKITQSLLQEHIPFNECTEHVPITSDEVLTQPQRVRYQHSQNTKSLSSGASTLATVSNLPYTSAPCWYGIRDCMCLPTEDRVCA